MGAFAELNNIKRQEVEAHVLNLNRNVRPKVKSLIEQMLIQAVAYNQIADAVVVDQDDAEELDRSFRETVFDLKTFVDNLVKSPNSNITEAEVALIGNVFDVVFKTE